MINGAVIHFCKKICINCFHFIFVFTHLIYLRYSTHILFFLLLLFLFCCSRSVRCLLVFCVHKDRTCETAYEQQQQQKLKDRRKKKDWIFVFGLCVCIVAIDQLQWCNYVIKSEHPAFGVPFHISCFKRMKRKQKINLTWPSKSPKERKKVHTDVCSRAVFVDVVVVIVIVFWYYCFGWWLFFFRIL